MTPSPWYSVRAAQREEDIRPCLRYLQSGCSQFWLFIELSVKIFKHTQALSRLTESKPSEEGSFHQHFIESGTDE